ncbi:MAG TPA: ATP-binding protein [Abditibacteriaceae bacterium]
MNRTAQENLAQAAVSAKPTAPEETIAPQEAVTPEESVTPQSPEPVAEDMATQAQMAAQVQHLSHLARTLSSEKHFLRALSDSVQDALIAFDKDGQFVLCNRCFEGLFGVGSEQMSGHNETWLREQLAERLQAPADFFMPRGETLQAWNEGPNEWTVELRSGSAPDDENSSPGKCRILRWYSGPVHDSEGQLVGRVATQRDITKETEVDRMKTEFISIVSHELRTPMTSIKGYVDLILDGDTGEVNHLQREFLQTVQRNTRRLVSMINDMLDIERIESGGVEFDLRPLVLSDVIEQALSLVKPQADEKKITIEVVEPELLGRVLADFDRTLQVLTNLLSNAIKYTPAPPVSAGKVVVEVQFQASHARLAVRDTGIGIAPEDQAQLFQKFFRADNSVTREAGGTGLGLSITRALVEKMGGELSVSSEAGQGSEFAFILPLASPPKPARPALTVPHQSAQRVLPRVLVVDDDPDIVDLISLYLQRNGYDTTAAYSGPEALRLLKEESFDAMTLDVLMPHMDGFDVLHRIKENPAIANLPVVIVSVTNALPTSAEDIAQPLHRGNYGFITKPFDEQMLRNTIARALHPRAARYLKENQANGSAEENSGGDTSTHMALAVLVDPAGEIQSEVATLLREQGAIVEIVKTPAEALAETSEQHVDLIVLNPLTWGEQTMQLIEALQGMAGGSPFLLFTQPDSSGQYVISSPYEITAETDPPSSRNTPQALRDICARLDHLLQRDANANVNTANAERPADAGVPADAQQSSA